MLDQSAVEPLVAAWTGTNEKVDPAFQSILAMQETRENVMQMPNVFTLH